MITRRSVLEMAGGAMVFGTGGALSAAAEKASNENEALLRLSPALPSGTKAEAALEVLEGKKPLIRLTERPPNYEAPLAYLHTPITPNDEFFVRYHLADIPHVDAGTWTLTIAGDAAHHVRTLGLDELKKLPAFEVTAVCQCAGNRRGLFQPHVPGVQWGSGAIGCAKWKGARLSDVLGLAGFDADALEVTFDGADGPVHGETPDFAKCIPLWKALEETTLVAYEMNGMPLPHWNGFPARIVVPGWAATYWVKHLTTVKVVKKPFDGFWMKSAYRIPAGKFPQARFPSQEAAANAPITELTVNSLIGSPSDGAHVKAGHRVVLSGIAWDGGSGIKAVEVSTDGGKSWTEAALGTDLGPYAFRGWSYAFTPKEHGQSLAVRATSRSGQTQPSELVPNPAGYHHNVIQTITVGVV